jgi:hypothetical protein
MFGCDMKLNSLILISKYINFLQLITNFFLKKFVEIDSARSANSHTEECEPQITNFISESGFAK